MATAAMMSVNYREEEKKLKCFQHCDRQTNIVCFVVPRVCPICQNDTEKTPSRIPPYILPSPFVSSSSSCSVILKPTDGTFLKTEMLTSKKNSNSLTRDYVNSSDLHIGITDSKGTLYDYDQTGLHKGTVWKQCVSVQLLNKGDSQAVFEYDSQLQRYADASRWTPDKYEETSNNCFDFVLGFLQSIGLQNVIPAIRSKRAFCEEFLLEQTRKAARFVALYRQVEKFGFVCQNNMSI